MLFCAEKGGENVISYTVIRSRRKTAAIHITAAGQVEVRCPMRMRDAQIRGFVESKSGWIEAHLAKVTQRPQLPPFTEAELKALAERARILLAARTAYYAPIVGVSCGRITIRSQHTLWGSCSAKGNLNFNCLLALVPPETADYVVVHELCHRKEMNHSARFWAEVARVMPDWQTHRKWLKDNGGALIARLPK